eukprot:1664585-Rhodomonas_salina.4
MWHLQVVGGGGSNSTAKAVKAAQVRSAVPSLEIKNKRPPFRYAVSQGCSQLCLISQCRSVVSGIAEHLRDQESGKRREGRAGSGRRSEQARVRSKAVWERGGDSWGVEKQGGKQKGRQADRQEAMYPAAWLRERGRKERGRVQKKRGTERGQRRARGKQRGREGEEREREESERTERDEQRVQNFLSLSLLSLALAYALPPSFPNSLTHSHSLTPFFPLPLPPFPVPSPSSPLPLPLSPFRSRCARTSGATWCSRSSPTTTSLPRSATLLRRAVYRLRVPGLRSGTAARLVR